MFWACSGEDVAAESEVAWLLSGSDGWEAMVDVFSDVVFGSR